MIWICKKEIVEKSIDIKTKVSLQPLFRTREIDFRYPKNDRPSAKKEKDIANQEYQNRNKDKHKAKSQNLLFANRNQP